MLYKNTVKVNHALYERIREAREHNMSLLQPIEEKDNELINKLIVDNFKNKTYRIVRVFKSWKWGRYLSIVIEDVEHYTYEHIAWANISSIDNSIVSQCENNEKRFSFIGEIQQ